jgi:Xanthine and CO dehydrogenases maturation factor, XdhC/CoxF family
MTTHRAVIDALASASARGNAVVLATVVHVTGSSYGGVGARMVVNVDGSTVGLVSGGCLETDLAQQARSVVEEGRARVVTYDTRADDDAAWGLGLGCNGLIDVLLEPLNGAEAGSVAGLLLGSLRSDTPSVLATVIDAPPDNMPAVGAHAVFNGDGVKTTGNWGDGALLSDIDAHTAEALRVGRKGLVLERDGVRIAFEVIQPVVRLLVCGSGPDAVPVVRFATELGWDVTVVDHRPVAHAPVARFPGALVVECGQALRLADAVALTSRTAAVIMSHHYARDLEYLQALLGGGVGYIGILGPRARTERMFAEMESEFKSVHGSRDVVFGPIGLDIGGDGPDAIALSIVSEVSSVIGRRAAGHLRDRNAPLHEASSELGNVSLG